jgi:RNA polymerase sigma-70 factor (ECF subfamily)
VTAWAVPKGRSNPRVIFAGVVASGDTPDTDALIVAIARSHDRAAFAALFRHFAPRLKSFLHSLGTTGQTEDDLVQEVMLTVWRRAPQFAPERGNAASWIFTIARNTFVSKVRRQRRPEPLPDDPAFVPDDAFRANAPRDPESSAAHAEAAQRLLVAMSSLPREQADVLRGAYFGGRTLGEIAAEQKVPLGTVKTRARLALERLRELFSTLEVLP